MLAAAHHGANHVGLDLLAVSGAFLVCIAIVIALALGTGRRDLRGKEDGIESPDEEDHDRPSPGNRSPSGGGTADDP